MIAPSAVFFWPDGNRSIAPVTDSEIAATLDDIRAAQQVTTNSIKVVKDNLAAGRIDMKTLSDQLSVLAARVDALQNTGMQMLHDNAELRGRIAAIQVEMAPNIVSVAEQPKVLMPRASVNASAEQPTGEQDQIDIAGAKASDTLQAKIPLPPVRPTSAGKRKPVPQQAQQPPQPSTQARFLFFGSRP